MPFHSTTIFTLAYLLPLSLAHLPQNKKYHLNFLSSITKALLTHTLASFWRKQSCKWLEWYKLPMVLDIAKHFGCDWIMLLMTWDKWNVTWSHVWYGSCYQSKSMPTNIQESCNLFFVAANFTHRIYIHRFPSTLINQYRPESTLH